MSSEIGSTIALPEPELVFSAERESYRDIHPLRGLARYGPYSNSFFVSNPIQIAPIAPFGESRRLNEFLSDQIGRASCRERVCQYVKNSVVAVSLKKKNKNTNVKTQQKRD